MRFPFVFYRDLLLNPGCDDSGSDEVGTGDYFGPIVVTASYVTKEDIPYLEELGVKDSKKMRKKDIFIPKSHIFVFWENYQACVC